MVSRLLDIAWGKTKKDILDAQCQNGQTILHCTVWEGSAVIVDLLLEAGANANTKDNN